MVGISLYKSETLRVGFHKFGWIHYSLVVVLEVVEGRHSQHKVGSITAASLHPHSVIIIYISLSSSIHLPLSALLWSDNPFPISLIFKGSVVWIITSSSVLGWQSFDSIDIHHHFLYCYARDHTMLHRALYRTFVWVRGPKDPFINQKCSTSYSGSYFYTLSSRTLVEHAVSTRSILGNTNLYWRGGGDSSV